MLQDVFMDGQCQVRSHHVRIFQRTQGRQPQAKSIPDTLVHGCCICNSVFHNRNGLPPQCVLQPVAHKTRRILVHPHRMLSNALQQIKRPVDGLRAAICALRSATSGSDLNDSSNR